MSTAAQNLVLPTPTARPALTAKGTATRGRIVEAAATLIRERGAAGTSIDEVRARSQVSASQMYHYFGDKRELVRAVVALEADRALAEQQPQLDRLDSVESLRAWRDGIVVAAHERGFVGGSPLGALAAQLAETDPDARPALVDGFDRWQSRLQSGLTAMRDTGLLGPEAEPERLALMLLTAVQGGLLLSQVRRDSGPLEASLDAAIAQIESMSPAAVRPAPQPRIPAMRRTPTSPSRAQASGTPPEQAAPTAPRTPLRPRRPTGR